VSILWIFHRFAPGRAADIRLGATRIGGVQAIHIAFPLGIGIPVLESPVEQGPVIRILRDRRFEDGSLEVFWWFERRGELLRIEVLELGPDTFELRVIRPDGSVSVETFSSAQDLAKRQRQLEESISREGWHGPHGWVM
jgi:hypothetical protein